jgi:hypothetical protein
LPPALAPTRGRRTDRFATRLACGAVTLAVGLFVALEVPAMLVYPGGTWWDRTTRGARFWENFLCDLEWSVALNGQPNPVGSRLAQAAMLVIVLAFVPFWWILPRLFERPPMPRLGRGIRALGTTSVAGMVAVALMPSERFGALHGVAVVVAGVPGLSAAVLAVAGLLRSEARPLVAAPLGAAMLGFALVDFGLYVRTLWVGGPGPLVLPVAQKCALLLLLAWMLAVAARVRSRDASETRTLLDAPRTGPQ